jgi:hypothetical protein
VSGFRLNSEASENSDYLGGFEPIAEKSGGLVDTGN